MQSRRLALAVVILAAIGALVWFVARKSGVSQTVPLALPASPSERVAAQPAALESDRTVAHVEQTAPAPAAAPSGVVLPEKPATLRARCIDEQRRPIEGVRLMAFGQDQPGAVSAADGRLVATITVEGSAGMKMPFRLVGAFYVSVRGERVLEPGKECDLGDIVMKPGARIRGSVVDESGQPIAQAWLTSTRKSSLAQPGQTEPDSSYARSSADGTFVLDGVPAGTTCVSARASHYEEAEQTGLELVLGRELSGVVLTLAPETDANESGLLVRVLDPSGKPLNGVMVNAEWQEGARTSTSIGATDERGERWIAADASARANIAILDELFDRFPAAFALAVPVSQRTLEIQLEQGTPRQLLVVDEHDAPIKSYAARMIYEPQYQPARSGAMLRDGNGLLCDLFFGNGLMRAWKPRPGEHKPHPGGRSEFAAASYAFVVQVDAEGFAPGEAGPYPALGAPDEIRIVLEPLPGIRGQVVAQDKPVDGAWVKLFHARESRSLVLVDGFPSRFEPVILAQTKTAADGSFALALRDAGHYMLQAGKAELGEAESEALDLESRSGANGIVLALPELGAIEGRLLVPFDESAHDRVVGASRGDGRAFSTRTDAEGRFRFEKLTPGAWLLRPLAEDIDPAGEGFEVRRGVAPNAATARTCAVRAGETTQVEIDLRQKAIWVGDVELAGWDGGQGTASLDPAGASFSHRAELQQVALDALRMAVDQPGDYALHLAVWKPGVHGSLEIDELVQLAAGENMWKLAGPAATLVIANTLGDEVHPILLCELPGNRRGQLRLNIAAHSEVTIPGLPPGRWTRVHYEKGLPVEDESIDVSAAAAARMEWK